MYYTYIIRCTDNSLYTGITTDIYRRFKQHKGIIEGGAKFMRGHTPVRIEAVWQSPDRKSASKLEYRIKKLTKAKKEELISAKMITKDFFGNSADYLDDTNYIYLDLEGKNDVL
ncbi:MAG: GIY-YIG nuclease family protein [Firmicutes bacterium]|nr:GIY-YIG nuclease family protein [Bacillota bacterium]